MEDFASYLHLLLGFFLLGAAINLSVDIAHVLKVALNLCGFSVTVSDISGVVPFVFLQACTTFGTVKLPVLDVVEEISTVAVYEGLPRRRATSESTTALINYLAVMALVNTVVGVEPTTQADLKLASLPVPVVVVRYLNMAVSLASFDSSLVPVYLRQTSDVPAPLLREPSLHFENTVRDTSANSNLLQLVSTPATSAVLPVAQTPRSQETRCGRLPFDVSALFRGQPLPACSAEDLAFWLPTTATLTATTETLVSRAEIDLDDLTAPGVYARSVPASGLFPSVSEAHIGFRAPCEMPPLPRVVEVDPVVESESADSTDMPATPAQFKWTAESGVPLMDALGISPATAAIGTVEAHSEAVSEVNFAWNVTSGVPLMKALGFASPALDETKTVTGGVDFKWTAESGVSLMDALGVSGVKLGVVHSV